MYIKKIKSAESSKWPFLIILVIIVSLITYFRVKMQMDMGPVFDTFDYLADAAEFAGKGIGYTDLNRPPLISFLTAIFFIFGGLSAEPVFIVDGFLSITGCIGLYLFFNERLSPLSSFVGSLIFATFPIVLTYTGAGFNDVSSVVVAIWAIYLTYLAVERNSKWFYASFPMAMLAFMTRFNMALIIFPIFLYIFINWNKIKNHRDIIVGMCLSLLILLPFIIYIGMKLGNPLYTFMDFFSTSGNTSGGSVEHFAYKPDVLYYLKNFMSYIGLQSVIIVLLTIMGFIGYLIKKFGEKKGYIYHGDLKLNKKSIRIKLGLIVLLIMLFIVTFGKVHYFATEFIFFAISYLAYNISKNLGFKNWRMDFLFISWFMAFFIFHSIYVTKDHRYFITMAPPVAYFLMRGFDWATNQLCFNYNEKNLTKYLLAIIVTMLILFSTSNQFISMEKNNENIKIFNEEVKEASFWLMSYDPQYKSKIIYADMWPYFAWYLQMNVGKMPIFRNNQTMLVGPKDINFTDEDKAAFNRELEILSPDYYISVWEGMNFTSYEPIVRFGRVTIFKRKE